MFKHIPPFAISRISVMMKEFKFLYGQALFRCGDIIKNIYIVINGSFKLLRKINRHSRVSRISPSTKFEYKIDI
jgi:CRP-like cAMP-binding protein